MSCPFCQFSLNTLKQMQEDHTTFYTAGGRRELWIAEVDEASKTLKMERSTKKITWSLDLGQLKDVHDRIHYEGLLLDAKVIDKIIPTWGNYVTGLLRHLGCTGKPSS